MPEDQGPQWYDGHGRSCNIPSLGSAQNGRSAYSLLKPACQSKRLTPRVTMDGLQLESMTGHQPFTQLAAG